MARIAGINIPPHKHAEIGLTSIYGIGRPTAQKICEAVGIPYSKKIKDLTDVDRIREEIAGMARDNARWLDRKGLVARTVTVKVRYDDFTTVTRSHSSTPTSDAEDIAARAVALLAKTDAGRRPVRLLGAGVHNLEPAGGDTPPGDSPQLRFEE